MLETILFFSIIFSLKSILCKLNFSNHLLYLLYPIELASIAIINEQKSYTTFLRWIVTGWFGFEYEYDTLKYIDNDTVESYTLLLSWFISFIIYQIFYLIIEGFRKNISKISFNSYNLKYLMINYMMLYLWNLNSLLSLESLPFLVLFLNFVIFNLTIFWTPGIIFNFIYGEYLYVYRTRYSFLIEHFHPKHKYQNIVLMILKSFNGVFITLYKYKTLYAKYVILINLILYSFMVLYCNIFMRNIKKYLLIVLCLSFTSIIVSIIETYYKDTDIFFILELIIFTTSIVSLAIGLFKLKRAPNIIEEYEMNSIESTNKV